MITNVGNPILKYTINILNLPFKGWFIEVLCSWLLRSDEWMPLYRDWCDGRSFNALLKDHPPTWWVRFRRNYPQDPCIYGIYANIWGILMGSMLPYIYMIHVTIYRYIYIYSIHGSYGLLVENEPQKKPSHNGHEVLMNPQLEILGIISSTGGWYQNFQPHGASNWLWVLKVLRWYQNSHPHGTSIWLGAPTS